MHIYGIPILLLHIFILSDEVCLKNFGNPGSDIVDPLKFFFIFYIYFSYFGLFHV